jgi:hypothetical protein
MKIYPKSSRALYYTLVALWLAFAPYSLHLMNLCMCVIMISISITSYALFITIKWTLAKHTKLKQ